MLEVLANQADIAFWLIAGIDIPCMVLMEGDTGCIPNWETPLEGGVFLGVWRVAEPPKEVPEPGDWCPFPYGKNGESTAELPKVKECALKPKG